MQREKNFASLRLCVKNKPKSATPQRDRLIKARNSLKTPEKESKGFHSQSVSTQIRKMQENTLKAIGEDLKKVDLLLIELINQDIELKKKYELMCSFEGVGPVIAREILLTTEDFTKFAPNQAKQFARYCGIVPLKKGSGVQVRKNDRIGTRGNRRVKTLLTMGAVSLIKNEGELKDYYLRKISEGKKTFTVINAMRNKIILRVFAVVRNGKIYEPNLNRKQDVLA